MDKLQGNHESPVEKPLFLIPIINYFVYVCVWMDVSGACGTQNGILLKWIVYYASNCRVGCIEFIFITSCFLIYIYLCILINEY